MAELRVFAVLPVYRQSDNIIRICNKASGVQAIFKISQHIRVIGSGRSKLSGAHDLADRVVLNRSAFDPEIVANLLSAERNRRDGKLRICAATVIILYDASVGRFRPKSLSRIEPNVRIEAAGLLLLPDIDV